MNIDSTNITSTCINNSNTDNMMDQELFFDKSDFSNDNQNDFGLGNGRHSLNLKKSDPYSSKREHDIGNKHEDLKKSDITTLRYGEGSTLIKNTNGDFKFGESESSNGYKTKIPICAKKKQNTYNTRCQINTLMNIFIKSIEHYCASIHLLINCQQSTSAKLFAFNSKVIFFGNKKIVGEISDSYTGYEYSVWMVSKIV